MKILMHLSFLGTHYCGYQIQPNGMTVQQKLNEAAKKTFGYDCDIVGCSRTDSGVHANHFCAAVTQKGKESLKTSIPIEKIPFAMSQFLPSDISVFSCEWVEDSFHPRYDVKYKEYVYCIWNHAQKNPFLFDRAWHYPRKITEETVLKMNQAAKYFCGTHDFTSYMDSGSSVPHAIRTIYEAEVSQSGDMIQFRVSANGFLYHMVRILSGTLIAVAENKIAPEDILNITESRNRTHAGITAPAAGLFLNRVVYESSEIH